MSVTIYLYLRFRSVHTLTYGIRYTVSGIRKAKSKAAENLNMNYRMRYTAHQNAVIRQ